MDKKPVIVVIDDDANILKSVQRMFHDEPYEVITMSRIDDVVSYVEKNDVDVVLSDFHMGKVTGIDLFLKLNECGKDTIRILMTGTPNVTVAIDTLSRLNLYKVILKPWNNDCVRALVREALAYRTWKQQRN